MRKRIIKWDAKLAYVVGLIATDGCLSKDGRHIDFTSKDLEQIENFAKILQLNNKIGFKSPNRNSTKKYYRIEFGDVTLYRFLFKIGLTPNKSKIIGALLIPSEYFIDFLRGCLDGDGYTYSYWDKRWRSSFQLYTGFVSASLEFLEWLKSSIETSYDCRGKISFGTRAYKLEYAKKASLVLIDKIYYKKSLICLSRKRSKIETALSIISKRADVAEWYTR